MSLDLLRKTAVKYWSSQDELYVVRSPLSSATGTGDTEEEAWSEFEESLAMNFPDGVVGELKTDLALDDARVSVIASNYLNQLSNKLGCDRGQAIEYLIMHHKVSVLPKKMQDLQTNSK